jgi:hypothetical protein
MSKEEKLRKIQELGLLAQAMNCGRWQPALPQEFGIGG